MGRNCGWLTAATAKHYLDGLESQSWVPELGLTKERFSVHGIYIPEMRADFESETARLKRIMDEIDNVNIFISEGAGVADIIRAMEAAGEAVVRDAFGHVKLDTINPGAYFAKEFAARVGAEKTLVQKSGYYSRAAAANLTDQRLIKSCVDLAVECAMRREGGVIGHDEENGNRLRAIEFERIRGGKPFDIDLPWFEELLARIGQPKGARVEVPH
jgi:pyrophosphate--fructose-6-phosphate 1-phosphotransferase